MKGSDILLGDDFTEKERKVQKIVKATAADAKKNDPDKEIRIGYGKFKIGEKWWVYDEEKDKFFRKTG